MISHSSMSEASQPDPAIPDQSAAASDQSVVLIGDQRYRVADFSVEARRLISAIQDVDQELSRHRRLQAYLEISRRSLIQELVVNLPAPIPSAESGPG